MSPLTTITTLSTFMYKYSHLHSSSDGHRIPSKPAITKKHIQWSINFVSIMLILDLLLLINPAILYCCKKPYKIWAKNMLRIFYIINHFQEYK